MSLNTARWLLRCLCAGLAFAAVAIVAWGLDLPAGDGSRTESPRAGRLPRDPGSGVTAAPELNEFQRVWSRRLQGMVARDVEVPDREQEETPKTVTNSPRIVLVGTILEAGQSRAIFRSPDGEFDLKGVGDQLEIAPAMRVEEIKLASVTLSYYGRTLTLELPAVEVR